MVMVVAIAIAVVVVLIKDSKRGVHASYDSPRWSITILVGQMVVAAVTVVGECRMLL